ncbi:MAG: hypothetical protein ACRDRJ_05250 [Streptosporangiaceae bacterium]
MRAGLAHLGSELGDRLEQAGLFQVPEHLMPVPESIDVADRQAEQAGDQFLLVPVAGDRLNDLVEIEVGEDGLVWLVVRSGQSGWLRAQEAHRRMRWRGRFWYLGWL